MVYVALQVLLCQGLRAYAAKRKLELQARDDAIKAIAKKVIKLISSTEEKMSLQVLKKLY